MAQTMEKQFTRGNLISIVTTVLTGAAMLVAVVTAFNRIDAKAIQNKDNVARLEADFSVRFANWSSQAAQMRNEITSLQVSSARTIAQYDALSRSLDEMKTSLRDITTILREQESKRSVRTSATAKAQAHARPRSRSPMFRRPA